MRFLQIISFYEHYTGNFYSRHPHLLVQDAEGCLDALKTDGFGAGHYFADALKGHGYDATMVIGNDIITQFKWAREHGVRIGTPDRWMHEIVLRQIEHYKPDVLFFSNPIDFDARFLRMMRHRPALVVGWRAADIYDGTDWRGYDLILSHQQKARERALQAGAARAEHFLPGFPQRITQAVADEPTRYDVVFCGQWNPDQHRRRNDMLAFLHRASRDGKAFSLGLHLLCPEGHALPVDMARSNLGGAFGMDMYRALRSARIAFNAESDLNKGEAGNMRLFEATGLGTFLLTEDQPNVRNYFTPGAEVETFRSNGELLEKIVYYLKADAEREAIAARGRERCTRDYSMERAGIWLDTILRENL